MIDRHFFFTAVRPSLFDGHLDVGQVEGLTAILDFWEGLDFLTDYRRLGYIMGTAHHETDKKLQPIREYGRGRGKPYGKRDPVTGEVYYGRGLVQLTWKENYRSMSNVVGVDLVNHPDRALEMPIAVHILIHGMWYGTFTGKCLSDYFNETKEDWHQARRIVNRLDQAEKIARYGRQYHAALRELAP